MIWDRADDNVLQYPFRHQPQVWLISGKCYAIPCRIKEKIEGNYPGEGPGLCSGTLYSREQKEDCRPLVKVRSLFAPLRHCHGADKLRREGYVGSYAQPG